MRLLLTALLFLALLFCYGCAAVFVFWMFAPYKVIQYKDKVIPLVETTIKQGGYVQIHHRFTKYIDLPVMQTLTIEDHVILPVASPDPSPNRKSSTPPGNYDRVSFVQLPLLLIPGTKARLHYYLCYPVNPIRNICYHEYTDWFTVTR